MFVNRLVSIDHSQWGSFRLDIRRNVNLVVDHLHQFVIEGEVHTLAFIVLGTWDRDAYIATLEAYVQSTFGGVPVEE